MKKYLLVSLTVLFAAAFLWAEEAVPSESKIDVKGEGQVEWGVDLGSGKNGKAQHGFKNKGTWEVKFPLINKGTKTSTKTDVPVYGEVVLKDIELGIKSTEKDDGKFSVDGKVGGLSAKFVFYGAYLQVYGAPSFKTNYASLWDTIETDDYKDTFKFEPGFGGAGFKLGYADKNLMELDVGLKFGSNGNWEAEPVDGYYKEQYKYFDGETSLTSVQTAYNIETERTYTAGRTPPKGSYILKTSVGKKDTDHSKYGAGFDFSMKPLGKMLGVDLTVNSTFGPARNYKDKDNKWQKGYNKDVYKNDKMGSTHTAEKIAFNLGTKLTSEPIDALKFTLAFDGGTSFHVYDGTAKGKETFAWDMLFDTGYKWVSGGVYVASAGTPYRGYNAQTDKETADMALYVKFHTKADKKEASNLVEGLDAGVYFGLFDLLSKAPKGVKTAPFTTTKLWAEYKANIGDSMWIKPFAAFWGQTGFDGYETGYSDKDGNPYFAIAYNVGVTYSPVEKVEVTAKWAHGKMGNNSHFNIIKTPVNYSQHKGTLTLGVKVEY